MEGQRNPDLANRTPGPLGPRATTRPRTRTREIPAGPAGPELELLLADGLRDAQIAEPLVVSEKTVDHHVSAILRKLDVRTRGEADFAAVRLGLTESRWVTAAPNIGRPPDARARVSS